jgi:hypothetical protein
MGLHEHCCRCGDDGENGMAHDILQIDGRLQSNSGADVDDATVQLNQR